MTTIKLKQNESITIEIQHLKKLGGKWIKSYIIDGDSWQAIRLTKSKN